MNERVKKVKLIIIFIPFMWPSFSLIVILPVFLFFLRRRQTFDFPEEKKWLVRHLKIKMRMREMKNNMKEKRWKWMWMRFEMKK
jgi:hypothetical protein